MKILLITNPKCDVFKLKFISSFGHMIRISFMCLLEHLNNHHNDIQLNMKIRPGDTFFSAVVSRLPNDQSYFNITKDIDRFRSNPDNLQIECNIDGTASK